MALESNIGAADPPISPINGPTASSSQTRIGQQPLLKGLLATRFTVDNRLAQNAISEPPEPMAMDDQRIHKTKLSEMFCYQMKMGPPGWSQSASQANGCLNHCWDHGMHQALWIWTYQTRMLSIGRWRANQVVKFIYRDNLQVESYQLTSLSYVSGKNPQQVKGANLPLKDTTSRRLADRKVDRFDKKVTKRGAVGETSTRKGKDYPVGPLLLGFFIFVVIGSSLFQIIRTATSGGMA
ncbi:hypothetical protein NC651_000641 [Populus alba x Populus x berolinensis]|nr:hypothetical protein NC651_000641 [Populus alba x Populus x berolinensis]